MSLFRERARFIMWGAFVWLVAASILAFWFWPHLPTSTVGWAAFIAFGPPLWALAEGAAEWFWESRTGRAISEYPSSSVRVLLGVMICLLVFAAIWGGQWIFGKV